MFGTLRGALDVRQVPIDDEALQAEVEGVHELRNGLPVLKEVKLHYRLRIPAGSREPAERALARHQSKCPTANTLDGSVAVSWTADIEEIES